MAENHEDETSDETGDFWSNNVPNDISRRKFLKLLGLGTVGAAAGATGANHFFNTARQPRRPGPTGHAAADIDFDTTIDAGDHVSPGDTIDGFLDEYLQTGNLIEFPPGEYTISRSHNTQGVSRFGIRGTGRNWTDVQFKPAKGSRPALMQGGGPGPFLLENVSLNERMDNESRIWLGMGSNGGTVVKDVEFLGKTPREDTSRASTYQLSCGVLQQDGVTVLENVRVGLDAPANYQQYPHGVAFLYAGPEHRGEIIVRDCHIHHRNSSGTRFSAIKGVITVEGGSFVNNQNACIRLSGGTHPSKTSTIDGAYIALDMQDTPETSEALRLDASSRGGYDLQVRNTEFYLGNISSPRGCISAPSFGEHGSATFTDCILRNESNSPMVNAWGFSGNRPPEVAIVFDNCHFTGSGGDFIARSRPGSIVKNSCIDMNNPSYNGFDTENISNSGCKTPKEPDDIEYDSSASGTETGTGNPC